MAYLIKRKGSPFYWLCFVDGNGNRRRESTGLRHDRKHTLEIRRAYALEAQRTAEEKSRKAGKWRGRGTGWSWVPAWLSTQYGSVPGTLKVMLNRWKAVGLFIKRFNIPGPESFLRQHCFEYIRWRTADPPPDGCFAVKHNTALAEIHMLSITMGEAMNRNLVDANPCLRLNIRKQQSKRKAVFSLSDVELIRKNIPKVKDKLTREMLRVSFEIGLHQAARLGETMVNIDDCVDLNKRTITFKTKTGKIHTTLLHPALVPLFKDLIRKGKTHSWDGPPNQAPALWAARRWFYLTHKLGLAQQGKTFHSTRYTAISNLARAGVSRTKAMSFAGHSESVTHAIYTVLQPDDLSDCVSALRMGKPLIG